MDSNFSKIRSFLWPIHRHELTRFVPMMLLFFLISFNYHILKILKDTLIITQKNSGAEAIPFLKVWAILPSAILFTFLFTKLSKKFNREKIFYVIMSAFLIFFAVFIFVLQPLSDTITLNSFADYLQTKLPVGFKGFIAIVRYWQYSLFYIMAESWSTIMLSLLLWMFIVDVLSVDQAKRYYSFFGVSRNFAGVLSGFLGQYLASKSLLSQENLNSFSKFCGCKTAWDQSLLLFISITIFFGILIMIIYRYLHKYVYTERYLMGSDEKNEGKQKVSFIKSILFCIRSKYVLFITLIVLCYNVLINLIEVLWKSQINELHSTSSAFTVFQSKVVIITGVIAVISSFFISGNLVRRMGWKFTALVTPFMLMLSGLGFFYFLFLKKYAMGANLAISVFGMSPLVLAVIFGGIQDIVSRALKYTVFDDTKEMAFIPLSAEEKLKGKAAIDGLGSRVGKSGSSLIMQVLFFIFATPMAASPVIFVIILVIFPVWIVSINKLSKQFEAKSLEVKKIKPEVVVSK